MRTVVIDCYNVTKLYAMIKIKNNFNFIYFYTKYSFVLSKDCDVFYCVTFPI